MGKIRLKIKSHPPPQLTRQKLTLVPPSPTDNIKDTPLPPLLPPVLVTEHDNSLFTKTTGKLQTGLTCHHKFNADTLHFIATGIEKNIDNFLQDIERVVTKCSATFPILSTTKSSESRKRKESSAKMKRRKIHTAEARKKRACFIFLSLGVSPIDNEYGPSMYGIQQVEGTDYETLSLFTFITDKACLRDLLNSRSFVGEAENVTKEFLFD